MRFSERYGHKPVRELVQIDSVNTELRNVLWSALKLHVWDNVVRGHYGSVFSYNPDIEQLCIRLWLDYYKLPLDTLGDWPDVHKNLRKYFFECRWFEVYDFIEFVSANYPYGNPDSFVEVCNFYLKRECAAYRFVGGVIAQITEEEEVVEIELALKREKGPVRTHLHRALELLSSREAPDYRNSIKESISAIESLAGSVLGQKGTLGDLIKKLKAEIGLHPALQSAFSNLYGYTSDEDGVRHAIMESKDIGFDDAKLFLVVCSAFVNFVTAKIPPPTQHRTPD